MGRFENILILVFHWPNFMFSMYLFSNYDIERQPHKVKDGGGDSASKRTRTKTIIDPHGKFLQRWNIIFVLSCVIAILLDPLFFYLPVINGDKKCIELDKRLWNRALFLRSFNDMIYLMHIILQFRTGFIDKKLQKLGRPALITDSWKIARRYLWPYFLLDLLVILPIPQVYFYLTIMFILRNIIFTSCCN